MDNPAKRTTNLTQLVVTFDVTAPLGPGYELVIRNFKGESNAVGGFSVVE